MICEGHLHVTASGGGLVGGCGGVLIVLGDGKRQKGAENVGLGQEVKPGYTHTSTHRDTNAKHIDTEIFLGLSGLSSA